MAKRATKPAGVKSEGTASPWLEKIDNRLKAQEEWQRRAKKIVQRYRDERDKSSLNLSHKVNILWANTEVLRAALYARTSKPDVRRRFPDAEKGNSAARVAAEVLERAASYVLDTTDVDTAIIAAIDDHLLPGRGVCRVSYEPEIEGDYEDETDEGAPETGVQEGGPTDPDAAEEASEPAPRLVGQKLCIDYIYWEDYAQGVARQDKDVPWRAYRHVMRLGEFEARWPDAKKTGLASYQMKDVSGVGAEAGDFVEVWEIWDKAGGKKRIYVARGYADILNGEGDDDPYMLESFFPSPRPLCSITTTDTDRPVPEYLQYQDQATELDTVSTRIYKLTRELKWNGIYDASIPDGNSTPSGGTLADMAKADDGEFLPWQNFGQVRDKGGIEAAFGFRPIERISPVIVQLSQRRQQLIDEIFQITGISDIVRGSTDPRETKGAQQLKAQFGSMRMQARQREVQRFIRDLYRMVTEVIAEHFTQETLAQITAIDLPTAIEQQQLKAQAAQMQQAGQPMPTDKATLDRIHGPTWDDVMQILRSDKLRGYRVDIETDTTALEDADAEKQRRVEAMTAMSDMMEKAYQAAITAPKMLPLIKEMTLFGLRSFKPARSLEQAVEDAFDELINNPPPPPQDKGAQPDKGAQGPDPFLAAKVQVEAMTASAKARNDTALLAIEQHSQMREDMVAKREQDRADALAQADIKDKQDKNALKAAELHQKGQGDTAKLALQVSRQNSEAARSAALAGTGGRA